MTSKVCRGQAHPDILQRGLTVWPLNDDIEKLLYPLFSVSVVKIVQQLLPADCVDVGGPDPDQHNPIQPLLQTR